MRVEMERRRLAVQDLGLPYLVAEEDGAVQGFAYAGPYRPRSGYRFTVEDSVYVAPGAHGKGIGRRLLAEVIARAEALGRARCWRSSAIPAMRLPSACMRRWASASGRVAVRSDSNSAAGSIR